MKNGVYFLALLLTGSLWPGSAWGQNTGGETYFKASGDVARLVLSGPSYQDFITYGDVLGFNVGLYYNPVGAINNLKHNYDRSHRQPAAPDPTTLLASRDTRPGPMLPPDKDAFLSHVSLLYGVQLIGKGGKYSDRFGSATTRMTYLEIPAYALYTYDLPDGKGRLFGGLGVYLAYGLWGTLTFDGSGGKQSFSAFDKDNGYNRFDAGLTFMGGYQLPTGLRLSLDYELGLVNIDPAPGNDKTKTSVLSLNVAYPLKKLVALVKKK